MMLKKPVTPFTPLRTEESNQTMGSSKTPVTLPVDRPGHAQVSAKQNVGMIARLARQFVHGRSLALLWRQDYEGAYCSRSSVRRIPHHLGSFRMGEKPRAHRQECLRQETQEPV